ncbi:MAG: hypothetical protein HYY37_02520 [Candidatus Aenigmarchaeota archaeon]|nr:hypothetical protein [Candidatus Aenigmarchaeota archaeon]
MVTIAARADRVAAGSLDELHFFKQKKYKHIFFCPSCIRSFESAKEEELCKFCGGHVRKVGDLHKHVVEPVTEKKHRFYCPKCQKIYEHAQRLEKCAECGTQVTHFYGYQDLGTRDKILYHFHRLFKGRRQWRAEERTSPASPASRIPFRKGEELPTK